MGTATKTKQPLNEVETNCGEDGRSVYARMRLRVCMECVCVGCRPHTSGVVTSVAVFYATPLFPLASYYDSLPP